jgi:BMFP domain-containing protein YqiC
MTLTKIFKLLAINIGLAAINILMYSKLFLGITDRGSIFLMIVAIVVSIVTIGLFFYLNIKILSQTETIKMVVTKTDQESLSSLSSALRFYISNNIRTFREDLTALSEQIDKFQKKKNTYVDSLLHKFKRTEMTFAKFYSPIENVEDVFKQILKGVLSRLNSFDEEEYETMLSNKNVSRKTWLERKAIYDEYKSYVSRAVQTGDDILLKIDRLQLEVSKISTMQPQDIEKLESVKEIDRLISDVKWYK